MRARVALSDAGLSGESVAWVTLKSKVESPMAIRRRVLMLCSRKGRYCTVAVCTAAQHHTAADVHKSLTDTAAAASKTRVHALSTIDNAYLSH